MEKKDISHLGWIYNRMCYELNENENADYMIKFRKIIGTLNKPNIMNGCDEIFEKASKMDNNKKQSVCTYKEAFGDTYLFKDDNVLSYMEEVGNFKEASDIASNFEQISILDSDSYIQLNTNKTDQNSVHKGLRYNSGKLRYDLLHTKALEGITKVLTKGAEKYAPRNWELGMPWSNIFQSLERHLAAIKSGEDYDPETGELHADHIQCNAHFLSAYYHIYPQGDDRNLWFKRPLKRLYLDIDGVLADFEKYFLDYLGLPKTSPTDWNDYRFRENFKKIENDNAFWMGIPRLFDPSEFDYPITGYVTARPIDNAVTSKWLENAGFPKGDLINVGSNGSKVDILKEKCDVFVDDSIYNFTELQNAGVTCFLMSRPHNKKYNVGIYRVADIKELLTRIKNL